jgi:hypothetical protein
VVVAVGVQLLEAPQQRQRGFHGLPARLEGDAEVQAVGRDDALDQAHPGPLGLSRMPGSSSAAASDRP